MSGIPIVFSTMELDKNDGLGLAIFRACLVDCNRHYNVIVIPMFYLFFSLVIFLLQEIVIPYE